MTGSMIFIPREKFLIRFSKIPSISVPLGQINCPVVDVRFSTKIIPTDSSSIFTERVFCAGFPETIEARASTINSL